ncbi:MAG: HAD-IIIC family phosphatase [Gemmatimonadaceae bacterium]
MLVLRNAVKRRLLPVEQMERAGRFILRELTRDPTAARLPHVVLLGQCTTSWLAPVVAAIAWAEGSPSIVSDGEYDNVYQDVSRLDLAEDESCILILLPWNRRLLSGSDRSPRARIEDELSFWRQIWRIAAEKHVGRIIQVGYDWITPGPGGYHLEARPGGGIHTVRSLNNALQEMLPSGAFFVSLDDIAGQHGRQTFYDPRQYAWTKQPFTDAGCYLLARHLCAAMRAVTVGPRKVIAVDLDNTIWGGLVGEVGPHGVSLGETVEGEAFRAVQLHLKGLRERGILLVACSKNNSQDAREPFLSNPHMVLSLEDFAAFEANWEPKPDNLRRIAHTLGLNLDSFVFLDDSAAERELVQQVCPEVAVIDLPDDPAEYVRALSDALWFEARDVTLEDTQRSQYYAAESMRRESVSDATSMEAYLASLEMIGDVRELTDADVPRVVQLLGKTNQFNLTTRRHGEGELRALLSPPGAFALTLRLRDRFGDHGLVAAAIAVPNAEASITKRTLSIDSFVMSCRVIGRTAEHYLMNALLAAAHGRGYAAVRGEFVPTPKNAVVRDFYAAMGFVRQDDSRSRVSEVGSLYERSLSESTVLASHVRHAV